jgi:OOP family OmpA-OmpF porin
MRTLSIATAGVALVLAGCAGTELEDTRNLNVQGGSFDQSLYQGYVDRSDHEYGYGDYESSDLFARRAQRVAAGEQVLPLQIRGDRAQREEGTRMLEQKMPELGQARQNLMSALQNGGRQEAPQPTAAAQVAFDCWLEETQPEHVETCKQQFRSAIQTAQAQMEPEQTAEAPETTEPAQTAPQRTVLYFDFDESHLRNRGDSKVDRLENRLGGDAQVAVTGHADRAGPKAYNQELSLRRAQQVAQALVNDGVARDDISIAARGESQPAVPTGDGVREQDNRRVVINVK